MPARKGDRVTPPPRPGGWDVRFAPRRQHRLKGAYATRDLRGVDLEQWQYELTTGGRIWYCPDPDSKTVWLTLAGTGHPWQTS